MTLVKLPDFLFCENRRNLPGAGLVLDTRKPWIIGRVVQYDSFEAMSVSLVGNKKKNPYGTVRGYNIAIQFAGTLKGNVIEVRPQLIQQLQNTMSLMAEFYLMEKIESKPGYFDRYFKR